MEKHRGPERVQEPSAAQNHPISRTRMSNARVRRLCQEMPGSAAEVMGKLYPAYKLGAVEPYVSDWIPGVYLRIRLRRRCPRAGRSIARGWTWSALLALRNAADHHLRGLDGGVRCQLRFSGQGSSWHTCAGGASAWTGGGSVWWRWAREKAEK